MGISPFKRGDYVRVRTDYFLKEQFDVKTSPLKCGEIGIVTAISASGDKRSRYVKVNGKAGLYHFSMFEGANPTMVLRVYLKLRYSLA